jgi:hypothetical protein
MATIRLEKPTKDRVQSLRLRLSNIAGELLTYGDVVNLLINRYESFTPNPEYVKPQDFEGAE